MTRYEHPVKLLQNLNFLNLIETIPLNQTETIFNVKFKHPVKSLQRS